MFENKNIQTQPLKAMAVFNNWNAIIESWYCVGEVSALSQNKMFTSQIGNQELIVFRTEAGKIHCLDAFCSHMGLRLNTGTVIKDKLRCKFRTLTLCYFFFGTGNINTIPFRINFHS